MPLLPLDLFIQVTDANRTTYRWDANRPGTDRPQNLSFRTKVGEGFSDASLTLSRRIDLDYRDTQLLNDVVIVGADGMTAYEGRIAATPRSLAESHSMAVTVAGYMAHAKDRKFTEIYVDRDQGGWGDMSRARQAFLLNANQTLFPSRNDVDPTDSSASVVTELSDAWAAPFGPISEAWYDAGPGVTIGAIAFNWARAGVGTIAPWEWTVGVSDDDKGTNQDTSANLRAAGPSSGTLSTIAGYRYGVLRLLYTTTPDGAAGAAYGVVWSKVAVYGAHRLTTYTGELGEPVGLHVSDVMKDIASRWCPQLDTSGVVDTTYVVQHLAFKDRTFPYDAFLELNKYHLWHLGVWENKTLTFKPYDLTDYVWEIRTDDEGTTFSPEGPSTESVFNGVVVAYTDILTGVRNVLTPVTNGELKDTSFGNPWNQQGIDHWDEIELSSPTTGAQALQVGRTALIDRIRPKAPGTITVQGYIRDRSGIQQPVWKVRAGDTIAITNFPNDAPRLIVETDYDDMSKQVRIAVDQPFALLEAYLDRIGTALASKGLG